MIFLDRDPASIVESGRSMGLLQFRKDLTSSQGRPSLEKQETTSVVLWSARSLFHSMYLRLLKGPWKEPRVSSTHPQSLYKTPLLGFL